MAPTLMADGSVRDKSLAWAMVLLFSYQVLNLIADSIRLPLLLESRTSDAHRIAGWLDLVSNLPLLAATAFGLFAFLAGGNERTWWLRRALLLAALGFASGFVASVFEYGAIQSSPPDGLNLALLAACVASFAFAAGAYLAASAVRNGSLRWSSRVFGIAQLCVGVSSWAYVLVYSDYPRHNAFARGLLIEGFGAFLAGIALFYASSAFRGAIDGAGWIPEREKRLRLAAAALGFSFLLIGLGEAQRAAGIPALGYVTSFAVVGWIFALSQLVAAAAFLFSARGFKAAAGSRG